MEDNVKIYKPEKKEQKNSDVAKILEEMTRYRVNGNIEKAEKLGRVLAEFDLDLENAVAPKFLKPDIMYQIRVLLAFTAEATIQKTLLSTLLSTTAINSMYARLESNEPGFYKNISDGMAYSFYYTAFEENVGEETATAVGRAFAMLCGVKDNDSFIETGAFLYNDAIRVITREIGRLEFKDL